MNTNPTTSNAPQQCPVCGKTVYPDGYGWYQCPSCGYSEVTLPKTIVQTDDSDVEIVAPEGMYGWICPKCGAVMSPWTSTCPNCTQRNWTITCESNIDSNYRPEGFNRKESLGYE